VNINIAVKLDHGVGDVSDLGKYRAYSEVYTAKSDGTLTPLAWISSMVNVNHGRSVTLQLNLRWAALASSCRGPLVLKNTFIADASTNFPITRFDNEIVVRNSHIEFDNDFKEVLSLKAVEITDEMKFGVNPFKNVRVNSTAGPNLFLLHGYCSSENPFQKNSQVFNNAGFFLSPNSNDLNDAFAIKVHNFAIGTGSNVYSTVGHSQGGVVSLHLLNYYWSGLDQSGAGRKIQTVGTPWYGNSAAGSTANLGKMFGVGCGANSDLSLDGANVWLTGINEDHPQEVYFYTTTYKQGSLFGDYCNMAINAIIQWPNDGVSELKYSRLAGGVDCGNKEKYCHTTGMKYEAQYYDNTRNAEMNSKAAR